MSLALATPPASGLLTEWRRREPRFIAAALAHAALIPVALALALVDERSLAGAGVWVKPLKFLVSLTVWFGFLAWAAAWLPAGVTARRWWRVHAFVVILCAALEMTWIGASAALGVSSHYNLATPLTRALFNGAAFAAVLILSSAALYAVLIARNRTGGLDPAFRLAAILGFGLTVPLTLVAAFTLGGAGSHFVGGAGAGGLPVFGWSRDGGDLRVAHFFALHALHALPALGWAAARGLPSAAAKAAVPAGAALWVWLTLFTLRQALAGQPFLPFL